MVEPQSDFDLHQLLVPTSADEAQFPRDSILESSGPSSDAGSFVFIPEPLSRSNSLYSFSRVSFSSQLASLTSMNLPNADSLAANISAIPTATKAIKALNTAAEQIQAWTKKALKVLENLDAEDDVEWAAAAGRQGLDETDKTINQFEHLVNVYVAAIEELQIRPDIVEVRADDLQVVVEQMETTLEGWDAVGHDLKRIHDQVELAMEWEELWAKVLGEVAAEMDNLSQVVFEMEEKRHTAYQSPVQNDTPQKVDLNKLESYIEDPSEKRKTPNSRYSLPPAFEASPLGSPMVENPQDDSNLLSLFARMQPLRASLDFLPMRLSMFQHRAANIFPHACQEVEDKRERLEKNWHELSREAETLRRELSEDRWVIVFRNAGRQAKKMCESVEKSITKLQEALAEGYQRSNPAGLAKRIESFEAKRMHYGPAIERVLAIIQKGLKDRLTINGEILRLHKDLSSRMRDLTDVMDDLENTLQPVSAHHNQKLRDSISSIVSGDRSFSSTTRGGTPGSSPPSSIDFPQPQQDKSTPKFGSATSARPRPLSSAKSSLTPTTLRSSMLLQQRSPSTPGTSLTTSQPKRGPSPSPRPASVYRQGVYAPATVPQQPKSTPQPLTGKPRWSAVVKPGDVSPLQRSVSSNPPLTQRRMPPRAASSIGHIQYRSPLSREASSSPAPGAGHFLTTSQHVQHFKSFAERVAEPSGSLTTGLLDRVPYHRSRHASMGPANTIRSPSSLAVHNNHATNVNSQVSVRPPSALSRISTGQPSGPYRRTSQNFVLTNRSADHSQDEDYHHDAGSDYEEDRQADEPESSPLSRKTNTRPNSQATTGSRGGKRISLLPVPIGSGRHSSLGSRLGG